MESFKKFVVVQTEPKPLCSAFIRSTPANSVGIEQTQDTADAFNEYRIKDVRKRPRGTTPTSGPAGAQPSDAFSSAPSFQSTSFSTPSTQASGFNFGQSQSFPGATSTPAPAQPAQGSSNPFSFGGSGQPNFSFSSGLDTPSSNPFAASSFNQPASQPTSTGFNFNGAGNQATSQAPSFSFGGQSASTTSAPVMFGQPVSAPAADSMQISPAKPKAPSFNASSSFNNRNIFGGDNGTSNVFSQKPASNPFGGLNLPSTADKPSGDEAEGFAAKSAFASQPPTTPTANQPFGGLFGATPTASKPAEPQKPNFGTTPSSAQPFGGLFGSTPVSKPAEPEPANVGSNTATPSQPFAGLFGATPATSKAAEPEKPAGPSTTPAPANPFGGIFGATPAASKAAEPEKAAAFSTTPASTKPFGGLFGATPATSKAVEPEKQESPSTTPAPAQPFTGLFGATSATPTSQPATGNIFSAQPTAGQAQSSNAFLSKSTEQSSFGNPFAPKPPSDETSATNSQSTQSLFGTTASSQPASNGLSTSKPAAGQNPFTNLFGAKSTPPQTGGPSPSASTNLFSAKPAGANTSSSSLFAPKPAAEQSPAETAENQQSKIFASSSMASKPPNAEVTRSLTSQASTASTEAPPSQISGNIFAPSQANSLPKASQSSSGTPADLSSLKEQTSKVPMPDLSDIPSEVREEAELLWKLRTLNMSFKAEVATYNPEGHDFDNLILFYMKVRSALGCPVREQNSKQTTQTPSSQENESSHMIANDANGADEHENATSALFAKSFAASTSKPASQADLGANDTSAPASLPTPKVPDNPFKSLSTGQTSSFGGTTNGISQPAAESTPPSLGGNMFAKSTSNAQSSPALAGNMFAKSTSGTQGFVPPATVPKFGNGASGVDFMAQFQKKAEETAAKEKAKRKAEDFDSDEDDEEEWERQDAEKQLQKRAKLEGPKKKTVWDGKGFKIIEESSAEESPATLALPAPEKSSALSPSPAPSSTSIFESSSQPLANSENIFGHLPTASKSAENTKDSDDEDDGGQQLSPKLPFGEVNGGSDSESASHNSKRTKSSESVQTTKSSLDTPIPPPTAAASRSLFDRVESTTPQTESQAATSVNPFASLGTKATSTSMFGQQAASDHTWKPNTPIKFSTSAAPTESSAPSTTAPSTAPSSGGDNDTGDGETAPGAIFDLSHGNAGEEEEKVVFECRARAFKLETGWTCQGTGVARLLQHPSGRARVVLRAEPSGQVVLNSLLKKELNYQHLNNSVQLMVPKADMPPEHWAIRLKADIVKNFYAKVEEIKN